MKQVRIIVADDAIEFENQINKELELIGDAESDILPFTSRLWIFTAAIVYNKED